ncbi:hypothetical protein I3843_11G056000 [Carya illinoinensis]|nr:hypothetical protein I3843_11G056000 [Carya illinoinensis]
MEASRGYMRARFLLLFITMTAIFLTDCAEARRSVQQLKRPRHPRSSVLKTTKKMTVAEHLDIDPMLDSSNVQPYSVSSPFSLPPFESLGPMPLPDNVPPYCIYPPNTPLPPSTSIPTPIGFTPSSPPPTPFYTLPPILPIQSPPQSPTNTTPGPPEFNPTPNPPEIVPSPPSIVSGPPQVGNSPPIYVPSPPGPTLSPPSYTPTPPSSVPSPFGFVPSPPVFEPPVLYPPPTGPPPPHTAPSTALWCVAKPTVPDPIIQEAMDYACWSGADCASIEPQGSCFQPNTLFAHASYAFNSYWQRTKVAGGTCEFGGTAMLVTVDPSYDGCHFIYF